MSEIKDIAKRAEVSTATVYKVFSSDYTTGPDIRERVLAAAAEIGYSPKIKKNFSGHMEKVIGLIFSEAMNPFTNRLIDIITKELANFYYKVIVLFSNENEVTEAENIKLAMELNFDAIVYVPVSGKRHKEMESMIREGKPVIQFFASVYKGADTIAFNDELGTYLSTKQLLQNGHRKILMIYKERPIMPRREPGYYRAFREFGLEVDESYLYKLDFEDNVRLSIENKIQILNPTAIIAVNESIALSTVQALNELKLNMPNEVSLIIYDDLPWASASNITTVAHAFDQVGSLCRDLIIKRSEQSKQLRTDQAPVQFVIDPMIISRESVKIIR